MNPTDVHQQIQPWLDTAGGKWELHGVSLVVAVKLLGEALGAIRNGGGLRQMILSIWFGQNVPKEIARDYQARISAAPFKKP